MPGTFLDSLPEFFQTDPSSIYATYAIVIFLAVVPIVVGSFRAVHATAAAEQPMTGKDATLFPFIASAALFGLFLAFKFLPKYYVNLVLTSYFLLVGVAALSDILLPAVSAVFPRISHDRSRHAFGITIPIWKKRLELDLSDADLVALVPASLFVLWYASSKHWVANNVLGLAFSVLAISLMSCESFLIACGLLWGLFVYDIFWVFGTPVMVSVATQFDAPIKLLVPRFPLVAGAAADSTVQFSMLGLGDIVLPGVFCAMMLRFDAFRRRRPSASSSSPVSGHLYFCAVMAAYVAGLATTVGVMHVFRAAQPALLYLVPFCTGSVCLLSLVRGEWKDLVQFRGTDLEDAADETARKKKGDTSQPGDAAAHRSSEDVPSAEAASSAEPTLLKARTSAAGSRAMRKVD